MRVRRLVDKPEYLYRPSQIVRRLYVAAHPPRGPTLARLAWGREITVDPRQMIGAAVLRQGLYDIVVVEALWRLVVPGETVVDLGAHIGVMTSVLATRVGPSGTVHAFEPHPTTIELLKRNTKRWNCDATIVVHGQAVSDHNGSADLTLPDPSHRNDSMSSLIEKHGRATVRVHTVRLDDAITDQPTVVKLDVEGSEAAVIAGGRRVFAGARDVVAEGELRSPVAAELEGLGFTVFQLTRCARRPLLAAAGDHVRRGYEPQNLLATRDPSRARERFAAARWGCLRG